MSERLPASEAGALRLQLPPDLSGLAASQAALREFLARASVSERAAYYSQLAFEELITNVIGHGRAAAGSVVDVSITVDDARVVLDFSDDGQPFDPLSVPPPSRPDSIDDAPIGGLGIFLVRETAEHMAYRRVGGRNHLTVAIAQQGD